MTGNEINDNKYRAEKKYMEQCAEALAKYDGRTWKHMSTTNRYIFRERVRVVIDAYQKTLGGE